MQYRPRNAVDASSSRMCALMNGVQQPVRSASSSFPQEVAGVRSQIHLKQSSKGPSSENFLATGGFFECNPYRVTVLGCLKKKEDEQF